jgi:hypothetical protein
MNNAIAYLLNNKQKDIVSFRKSIQLLINNYCKNNPVDIICFYEEDFPLSEIDNIKILTSGYMIKFCPVTFSVPNYSNDIASQIAKYYPHPDNPLSSSGFSIGYRHMCRFFAGEIFHNLFLSQYRYICRLDTDSYILEPISYNIFDRLQQNNAIYGYINIQHDHPGVIKNLWEESAKYFKALGKDHIFKNENILQHKNRMFYTNFEVYDMEWFRGEEYQNYFRYIDKLGGIYTNRWGDAPIRYIALKSLVEEDKLYFYHDIRYFHQKEYCNNEIIDTFYGNGSRYYSCS